MEVVSGERDLLQERITLPAQDEAKQSSSFETVSTISLISRLTLRLD